MQYMKDLPEIFSQGIDEEDRIELEISGRVEPIPDNWKEEEIVFVGNMGGTICLICGSISKYDYIKPEDSLSGNDFTRLTIEGTIVTVS